MVRGVHDDGGNRTEWACFDLKGKQTLCTYGHHRSKTSYDEQGKQIGKKYFDVAGKEIRSK